MGNLETSLANTKNTCSERTTFASPRTLCDFAFSRHLFAAYKASIGNVHTLSTRSRSSMVATLVVTYDDGCQWCWPLAMVGYKTDGLGEDESQAIVKIRSWKWYFNCNVSRHKCVVMCVSECMCVCRWARTIGWPSVELCYQVVSTSTWYMCTVMCCCIYLHTNTNTYIFICL